MTEAHTPGPWVELETESSVDLEDCEGWQDIGTADGRVMAIAVGYARFPSDDAEHTANARLIAAAPDLLDALRLAVVPLGSTGPTPVYEAVLAAILKATTPNAGERG